jgi:hypothetical protein
MVVMKNYVLIHQKSIYDINKYNLQLVSTHLIQNEKINSI